MFSRSGTTYNTLEDISLPIATCGILVNGNKDDGRKVVMCRQNERVGVISEDTSR